MTKRNTFKGDPLQLRLWRKAGSSGAKRRGKNRSTTNPNNIPNFFGARKPRKP